MFSINSMYSVESRPENEGVRFAGNSPRRGFGEKIFEKVCVGALSGVPRITIAFLDRYGHVTLMLRVM